MMALRIDLMFLCTIAGLLSASASRADTIFPGGVVINQTWTAAQSPYILQGDVTIPTGSILKIEAGTSILVEASDTGKNPFGVAFFISGSIVIDGSTTKPVTIQPANDNNHFPRWTGLQFLNGATGSRIQYARLIEPQTGLYFWTSPVGNTIERIQILGAYAGVYIYDGLLTMDGVLIEGGLDSVYGIESSASPHARCSADI